MKVQKCVCESVTIATNAKCLYNNVSVDSAVVVGTYGSMNPTLYFRMPFLATTCQVTLVCRWKPTDSRSQVFQRMLIDCVVYTLAFVCSLYASDGFVESLVALGTFCDNALRRQEEGSETGTRARQLFLRLHLLLVLTSQRDMAEASRLLSWF